MNFLKTVTENIYLFRLRIWKGEVTFVVPYELYVSVFELRKNSGSSELFLILLFDIKNGNPLRGRSLTIRYVLDKHWKIKIKKETTPEKTNKGSMGVIILGKRIGNKSSAKYKLTNEITPKNIIQYRVFRISLPDKIEPSGSSMPSLNLGESAESFANGLLKLITTQAITENSTKEIRASLTSYKATKIESTNGIIQGIRMEILFFVQNLRVFWESSCIRFCLISCLSHTTNFTIIEGLSQAHNPESLFSMPIEALWKGEV